MGSRIDADPAHPRQPRRHRDPAGDRVHARLPGAPVHPAQVVGPQLGAAHGLEPRGARRGAGRVLRPASSRATSRAQGKERWGDKTPLHTWHVDGMARLFPDAHFIGMVRHPGGSVGSNMNRFGHPFGRAVTTSTATTARSRARRPATATASSLLRYEDLVLRPSRCCASCSPGSASRGRTRCSSTTRCRPRAAVGASSRARTGSTTRSTSRGWQVAPDAARERISLANAAWPAGRVLRLRHG